MKHRLLQLAGALVFALTGAAHALDQACQTSSNQFDIPTSSSPRFDHDPTAQEIGDAFADKLNDILTDNLGSLDCGPCLGIGCLGTANSSPSPLDVHSETLAVTTSSGQNYWETDYTVAAGGKVWLTCSPCLLPIN